MSLLDVLAPALNTATTAVNAYDQGKRQRITDDQARMLQAAQQKRQASDDAIKQMIAQNQAREADARINLLGVQQKQAEYNLEHPKPTPYTPQTEDEAVRFAGQRASAIAANTPRNIDPNSSTGVAARMMVQSAKPASPARPNETQMRASLVYPRAAEAAKVLDQFYTNGAPIKSAASTIPLLGNYALSPDEQSMNQAAETVASAILRLESGAAITQAEVKSYAKQFLPQPGDSHEVLEHKRATLHTQLQRMAAVAQPAMGGAPQLTDQNTSQKKSITQAEAAELRAAGVSDATIQSRYTVTP
jgi:hypothetical protein